METILIPIAVRAAIVHESWSAPRRSRTVSRIMDVVIPEATVVDSQHDLYVPGQSGGNDALDASMIAFIPSSG